MPGTIARVLTGVATLFIRQPNDARAEWSTVEQYAGDRSVKLTKTGSGNAGSTHLEIGGLTSLGITLAAWQIAIDLDANWYSFYHKSSAVTGNFAQFEFRFEDPNSDAWLELTAVPLQTHLGTNAWVICSLLTTTPSGYGGIGETGASFFDWALSTLTLAEAEVNGEANVDDASDWILDRVRIELWESSPERTTYIDSVTIHNVLYTIEPGGTAPTIELDSASTEIGYTEDGVTMEYNAETADIEVAEETVPIDRVLTKETVSITCNMAESSLYNIDKAMAGSVLSGSILTVGAGAIKTMNLKVEGTNPAGFKRAIYLPKVTATGTVGMAYKKGEKTVVPVTFQALKPANEAAFTMVDNAV